jgi:hypothetical protein
MEFLIWTQNEHRIGTKEHKQAQKGTNRHRKAQTGTESTKNSVLFSGASNSSCQGWHVNQLIDKPVNEMEDGIATK